MHIGIGAAILILGVIYFAMHRPGFRLALLWAAVVIALVVLWIIVTRQAHAADRVSIANMLTARCVRMLSAQMPGKGAAIAPYCSCTANWLVINSSDAVLWTVVGSGSFP